MKYLSAEVVICRQQQILNLTNQRSLFMTVRNTFEISDDDHPSLVTHARDIWWTLDSANAFVSPGVNSRGGISNPRLTALRAVGSGKMNSTSINRKDSRLLLLFRR